MYLSLGQAARETGKSKSVISNALKSGRLSGVRNGKGEWEIDPAELFRVFSPQNGPENGKKNDLERFSTPENALVELLKEQLQNAKERENQAREREQQALEREREGREREVRLLALLESESAARRDLELKLLPPPEPPPRRHRRLWLLLAILALAIAALVWTRTSAYWPLGG
jgi:hypothetical protein